MVLSTSEDYRSEGYVEIFARITRISYDLFQLINIDREFQQTYSKQETIIDVERLFVSSPPCWMPRYALLYRISDAGREYYSCV